jgi:hypothetical protein
MTSTTSHREMLWLQRTEPIMGSAPDPPKMPDVDEGIAIEVGVAAFGSPG